jgi:CheY-like chemotaxis protein
MANKPILIVEDDFGIRSCLEELFESKGYPVLMAGQGQEALDLLRKTSTPKPGLIFLYIMMPVMDGPAFLAAIQEDFREIFLHTPIFIMSARPDTHPLPFVTTGYLKKPFDLSEVSKIAAQYCLEKKPPLVGVEL